MNGKKNNKIKVQEMSRNSYKIIISKTITDEAFKPSDYDTLIYDYGNLPTKSELKVQSLSASTYIKMIFKPKMTNFAIKDSSHHPGHSTSHPSVVSTETPSSIVGAVDNTSVKVVKPDIRTVMPNVSHELNPIYNAVVTKPTQVASEAKTAANFAKQSTGVNLNQNQAIFHTKAPIAKQGKSNIANKEKASEVKHQGGDQNSFSQKAVVDEPKQAVIYRGEPKPELKSSAVSKHKHEHKKHKAALENVVNPTSAPVVPKQTLKPVLIETRPPTVKETQPPIAKVTKAVVVKETRPVVVKETKPLLPKEAKPKVELQSNPEPVPTAAPEEVEEEPAETENSVESPTREVIEPTYNDDDLASNIDVKDENEEAQEEDVHLEEDEADEGEEEDDVVEEPSSNMFDVTPTKAKKPKGKSHKHQKGGKHKHTHRHLSHSHKTPPTHAPDPSAAPRWYDSFHGRQNSIYIAIIGISALLTGVLVLVIACCCARPGNKKPKAYRVPVKNKVAFYKVDDDFDSDDELEDDEELNEAKET
jgi:hypothetical protein